MVVPKDHIDIKMLIGEDLQAPLPEHSLKNDPSSLPWPVGQDRQNFRLGASPGSSGEAERESNSVKTDDLCGGSTGMVSKAPPLILL